MLRVYSCVVGEHNLWLVLVAGLICALAAFTAFSIFEQARQSQRRRPLWLGLAGFVSGTGIWATHFVAMLAYQPEIPIGYDLPLTLLSIAAAVLVTGAGWFIAARGGLRAALLGGATIGAGIGTMHYLGMAAVKLSGEMVWDERFVAASVLIGIALSAAALAEQGRRPEALPWRPALVLTLAICGLHFTAMSAAFIFPDFSLAVPPAAIDSDMLTIAVVTMAIVILAISFIMVLFDRKLARNAAEEAVRLRTFADAAIEGLAVIDGDRILDANRSFLQLAGYESVDSMPAELSSLLPELDLDSLAVHGDAPASECRLVRGDAGVREVEALIRPLAWRNAQLRILAVRDISERKEAAERIAHLAFHDALTGLPNRAVFTDHLARSVEQAVATGEPMAVLCIDLDGFKAVNDLYGHPAGDAVLVGAAQRLRSVVRGNELVARLGGDEFAVVQLGGSQPTHAGLLSERILAALDQPFTIDGHLVRISGCVGTALFPADASSPADLIKNADMALYRAKAEGRATARFYEAAMDEALRQRRQLDADLKHAIDNEELAVHYQPLADLGSGTILGFEALLRWTHPTLGVVSPEVFIRLAEDSGLIIRLGEWVLRQACTEAARWTPRLKLSVNLSPVQFVQDDLAATVERVLAETGLDPDRLELEITEGLLIKDSERAIAILQRLKAMGVQISMDDFGTGYSSLSYFRMFPFDKVKIDQSFIREMIANPQARAIIRSVIGLGRGLGVPVVAEGVETAEQLEALRDEGCDQVQGYLIARPNPIGHFTGVIVDRAEATVRRRGAA
ncbi:bifunctional diguanylate cyclase/phosphodiesterase [Allosphingosinicella sp.]|jgi:diguanylate cyclase (GGDEF)-like protein/PAS domain S-box-containing protein|uniref:bifunctional diguanylate cyclase/phosphodiesterase n=1 Tax=Allosphingosinicella sp. TaxID=2823234 RepID=UPI002EF044A7